MSPKQYVMNCLADEFEKMFTWQSQVAALEAASIKPEQVIDEEKKKVLKALTFLLQVFHTVSPALAFQYVSLQPPDLEGRVPPYTDNLNSWLGQILQVWTNKQ